MNYKYNIYIYILLLALLFNRISLLDKKKLLAILIIIIISYILYLKISIQKEKDIKKNNLLDYKINNNLKYISNINNNNYNISKLPTKLKYLLQDDILINIFNDIDFIKKFNKSRYSEILINVDKMMKIYIYILSDIYDPRIYLSTFNNLRIDILELLYSIILIIPLEFKHNHGFNPITKLNKSIKNFIMRSRKMITIIQNYAKYDKNIIHLDDTIYTPYNRISNLPNIMP